MLTMHATSGLNMCRNRDDNAGNGAGDSAGNGAGTGAGDIAGNGAGAAAGKGAGGVRVAVQPCGDCEHASEGRHDRCKSREAALHICRSIMPVLGARWQGVN